MLNPELLAALAKMSRTGRVGPCDDGYKLVQEHSMELLAAGLIKRFGSGMAYGTGAESGLFIITKAGIAAHQSAKAGKPAQQGGDGSWPFPVRVR